MKIVLLAHALRGQGGALGGKNFISALKSIESKNKYLITAPQQCGFEKINLPQDSRWEFFPKNSSYIERLKFETKLLPSIIKKYQADFVLGLGNHGIAQINIPQAIWIRNAYLTYPSQHWPNATFLTHLHVWMQRQYFRKTLKKGNVKLLFCQTVPMRKHISEYYNFDIQKIKILPNAVSASLRKKNVNSNKIPEAIKEDKFNCFIPSKYYIHKNPDLLVKACLKYPNKFRDINIITTITEDDGKAARKYLDLVNTNNSIKSCFTNVGTIPNDELGMYYSNVQLVIMPTFIESFSITYMEAMYLGVPILTTDLDFAHYLCGEAAEYYDPWDLKDFASKLEHLKSSYDLRRDLTAAGSKQYKKFDNSWEEIASFALSEIEKACR